MAQANAQAKTLETTVEAWLLKRVLRILSTVDASITILPREDGVRFESLSADKTALVAVDVDWFRGLGGGLLFDVYDASRLMRALPWSRLDVKVAIDGNLLRAATMDGDFNAKLDVIEKLEDVMDGVLRNLSNGVKAVMSVDAFKLWSWFKPFSIAGESRAHFEFRNDGFTISTLNEDAVLRLDVSSALLDYDVNAEFRVSYYLGYATSFLDEVKRNGSVNVIIAQDKPMLIEAMLERGIVARIAQAPMVE
jgi:hypothetical protein